MTTLQISPLSALPQIRALGRHTGRDPLPLFWTASGAELLFTGSELWFQLECDYTEIEPWVSIELNGAWIARQALAPGCNRVCAFRGMTPGTPKHVRLLNDVQPMPQDPTHFLQLNAVEYAGGEFLPLPEPRYRLEFVGNSITSGEGTLGARQEEDWIGAFFSAENTYARLTSDTLGAEYRIVSQSGWGVVCGWDNDPHHTLPPYYEQVCGVAEGARNAALGAKLQNDFSAWQPDAVILNIGTNDESAFRNPAWLDPVTGKAYKLRTLPDGSCHPEDVRRLQDAACDFLTVLRKRNPRAVLIWSYGMLGSGLQDVLQGAVRQYCSRSGDTRAFYLPLPDTTDETVGSRQHPGALAHRAAAEVLTAFLKQKLEEQS